MLEILPLLVFTTLGGISAGAYAVRAIGIAANHDGVNTPNDTQSRDWIFPLTCIVLLGVGLLGTLMHLGQPFRFLNGMSNPASMISQESYWAVAFGIVLVVDLVICKIKGSAMKAVQWIGFVAAFGLMVVTGLAYQACTFVSAWSGAITVPLFIVGDFAMGVGLCLAFIKSDGLMRAAHVGNIALSLGWLAVIVGYMVHLLGVEASLILVAIGAIIGPVAAAIASVCFLKKFLSPRTSAYVVLACSILGVLLVRGTFFAAGIL